MGAPQSAVMGLAARQRPGRAADLSEVQARMTPYGEPIVQPLHGGMYGVAEDGNYFTAGNPTPGTAIAHVVSDTVSETAGYVLVIRNSDTVGGSGRRMYMDFVRLICNTVPASGTSGIYFWKLGPLVTHYTGTGTQLTPVNPNGDGSAASVGLVYFGACVTVADTAARLVDHGMLRGVIPVAGDEWIFKFGTVEAAGNSSLGGTVPLRMLIPVPPVIIPPQWHLSLNIRFPSNASTPAQYEVVAGWWER
jgi:hypothetical protein